MALWLHWRLQGSTQGCGARRVGLPAGHVWDVSWRSLQTVVDAVLSNESAFVNFAADASKGCMGWPLHGPIMWVLGTWRAVLAEGEHGATPGHPVGTGTGALQRGTGLQGAISAIPVFIAGVAEVHKQLGL